LPRKKNAGGEPQEGSVEPHRERQVGSKGYDQRSRITDQKNAETGGLKLEQSQVRAKEKWRNFAVRKKKTATRQGRRDVVQPGGGVENDAKGQSTPSLKEIKERERSGGAGNQKKGAGVQKKEKRAIQARKSRGKKGHSLTDGAEGLNGRRERKKGQHRVFGIVQGKTNKKRILWSLVQSQTA